MLDWEGLFKRYVWDERTTPYLVPVSRLTRQQADSEIFAYCLFAGILFVVVALGAMGDASPHGRSPLVTLYGFSVVVACLLLHYTKAVPAAFYLGLAPAAGLAYLVIYGLASDRAPVDTAIVAGVLLLLLWYSLRLIAVTRAYPSLPRGEHAAPRRRLFK